LVWRRLNGYKIIGEEQLLADNNKRFEPNPG